MSSTTGVLATLMAVAVATAGCATGPHAGRERPARPAVCTHAQLGVAFRGSSQPGTGDMALGIITVWDASPATCTLPGRLTVTGISRTSRPATGAVHFTVAPGPALSRDGTGPGRAGRMPAGEVTASLLLIAAGTHPAGAPSCQGHQVDPAAFRVTLASGGSLSAPNTSSSRSPALTGDGGLLTCRGSMSGQSPVTVSS
jgi:hypothetical protein